MCATFLFQHTNLLIKSELVIIKKIPKTDLLLKLTFRKKCKHNFCFHFNVLSLYETFIMMNIRKQTHLIQLKLTWLVGWYAACYQLQTCGRGC